MVFSIVAKGAYSAVSNAVGEGKEQMAIVARRWLLNFLLRILFSPFSLLPIFFFSPISQARIAPRQVSRALSTSAVARKDIIQDAYIRELHAYKAPAKVRCWFLEAIMR